MSAATGLPEPKPAPVAPALALADALRQGTSVAHRRAESTALMTRMTHGALRPHDPARLFSVLLPVYASLERAIDRDEVRQLWPGLHVTVTGPNGEARPLARWLSRHEALRADLDSLSRVEVPAAACHEARQYAEHLGQLPVHRLAAHVYLRYLGDLHGGQMLARRLLQAQDPAAWPTGRMSAFHDFGPPAHVEQLIRAVRQALDSLPLCTSFINEVVHEALDGFERHQRLFDALA